MMNSRDGFTGPVNLGNPGEYSMLQLAQFIIRLTDSKSKLSYMPLPQDDPVQRKPEVSVARDELEWTPTIDLEDGLSKTIQYFKNKLAKD